MRRQRLILPMLAAIVALGADDPAKTKQRAPNRLGRESSPYLLQHAHNPVDWYPWGPEAFEKAKKEDKPILLSVGYSSCYWCHVMERESFEDAAIAKALNARFVCIKVDREERPDVDAVYMAALQKYSKGSGGWPMTLFLFPDGRPFFAATYLPPRGKDDNGGFAGLIERVVEVWRDHRDAIEKEADTLTAAVRKAAKAVAAKPREPLSRAMIEKGQADLAEQFDPDFGGFGYDPENSKKSKFPEASNLVFLLHRDRTVPTLARAGKLKGPDPRAMVLVQLDRMARGGIRDHLGGGYHRYSTNRSWTVPHFEKMLYDNAQLASVHLMAFEATKDDRWKAEAEATLGFLKRVMTTAEGGFTSSLDAETGGEEGAYYVWTEEEIEKVLGKGEDVEVFGKVYGLDRGPNFDKGRFVLRESRSRQDVAEVLKTTPEALEARLAPLRAKLLAAREKRPSPSLDDKVLTSWNGLAIAAFADAYRLLKNDDYRKTAEKAADFLLGKHREKDGRLLRTSRAGFAKGPAYLEDYALLAHGLLRLHAATGDAERLDQARALTDRMMVDFADPDGGFFSTAADGESLLVRMKDSFDGAIPGSNSLAIRNLVALAKLTGETKYLDAAGKALDSYSPTLAEQPMNVPMMLVGLDEYLELRDERPAKPSTALLPGIPAKGVVTASAALAPGSKVARGAEVEATVRLAIGEGWHIYANPSGSEVVRGTEVALAAGATAKIVKVEYPRGKSMFSPGGAADKVDVYEGEVTIKVRLRLDAKEEPVEVVFLVSYQPCNDRACLAPVRVKVPMTIQAR